MYWSCTDCSPGIPFGTPCRICILLTWVCCPPLPFVLIQYKWLLSLIDDRQFVIDCPAKKLVADVYQNVATSHLWKSVFIDRMNICLGELYKIISKYFHFSPGINFGKMFSGDPTLINWGMHVNSHGIYRMVHKKRNGVFPIPNHLHISYGSIGNLSRRKISQRSSDSVE